MEEVLKLLASLFSLPAVSQSLPERGDRGLAHKAYGCLQIRQPYADDANAYLGTNYKAQECLGNRALSIRLFRAYMKRYKLATDEAKARCHNGDPSAARPGTKMHAATTGYWARVKALL